MALSSSTIAAKASLLLLDETSVRWSIPEMAKWINSGTRELVLIKPNALTSNASMLLAAGSKQSLTGATFKNTVSGATLTVSPMQLIDVVRNMGTDGMETSAGRAVTGLARDILDTTLPNWHSVSSAGEVRHFVFDPKDPKRFYVYPKATASPAMHLEVVISRAPTNALLDSATSYGTSDLDAEIDDIYESVLVDYVLYRAYSKDSQHTANAQRSQWHYQAFREALGSRVTNEFGLRPQQKFDGVQQNVTQPA